jgi:SAM-dependent methyltransferase
MSNSYEIVRYPGAAFMQTHVDRLATMAALFGMNPEPIDNARVLEIGCCDGGNLIPMALSLPGSQFVGIDLTEIDIESAKETASAVSLDNIEFHALDLTTLPGHLGQFDYIIAHGVYSWVPDPVREKLLAVIKASLSPNGVAYVSYNALPGGHFRLLIRDMMRFRNQGVEDPEEILANCRQVLGFVSSAAGNPNYKSFIARETEATFERPAYGLFHDELEANYHPVYFHEFAAHAERYGLQYLAEANYFDMRTPQKGIAEIPAFMDPGNSNDPIGREQLNDFVRLRRFRQTLLCHSSIPVDRKIRMDRLTSLFFSSPVSLVPSEGGEQEFRGHNKSQFKTSHPLLLSVLRELLGAWPLAVPFDAFPGAQSNREELCEVVHAAFAAGLIEVRTAPPNVAAAPGERPIASPLARLQAARSLPITTLRQTTILASGDLEKRLISLLDGTRTRADLLADLKLSGENAGAELDTSLNSLARMAILSA